MNTRLVHEQRVDLTPIRKQELADEIAVEIQERARLIDHKKNWVKSTTETIKLREARIDAIAQVIRQGFELHESDAQ